MMAEGRGRRRRRDLINLARLVWNLGDVDLEAYEAFGALVPSGRGGPPQLSDELQRKVDEKAAEIMAANSGLPAVQGAQ